jgi:hypothetical protein
VAKGKKNSEMNDSFRVGGVLFHASQVSDLKVLKPMPSRILDGEEVVFATQTLWFALVCSVRSTSEELDFGFDDGVPYVREMKSGAFELLKRPSNVYIVSSDLFARDERVGCYDHEFVSRTEVPVLDCISIDSVFDELAKRKCLARKFID